MDRSRVTVDRDPAADREEWIASGREGLATRASSRTHPVAP